MSCSSENSNSTGLKDDITIESPICLPVEEATVTESIEDEFESSETRLYHELRPCTSVITDVIISHDVESPNKGKSNWPLGRFVLM